MTSIEIALMTGAVGFGLVAKFSNNLPVKLASGCVFVACFAILGSRAIQAFLNVVT